MKKSTDGILFVFVSCAALAAALLAMRAWEVNDGIGGILMAALGGIFSFLPAPADSIGPSFRADSILVLTEARLIFFLNSLAVALSVISVSAASVSRRRIGPSVHYAAAELIGFGACFVVHAGIAFAVAAFGIATVVWSTAAGRKHLTRHSTPTPSGAGQLSRYIT